MVTVDLLLNFNDSHMAILQTLIPTGLGACQRDPIMQVSHGKQTLSSPYVIIVPLLLDPSEYNLVQCPVPVHHQYAQRLMVPESGITPTVSSDNQQTRTNFVDVFCAVFTIP